MPGRSKGFGLLVVTLLVGCARGDSPTGPSVEGMLDRPDGPALHWQVVGSGPDTLLVLHGGIGLHHRYLLSPLARLTAGRTLIFYDMRGRGQSAAVDTTALSFDADVADVDAVCRHFRLEKVTLLGHHWGAAVAAGYAVRHPERVSRLVLLSPFPVHNSLMVDLTYMPGDSARYRAALGSVLRLYDSATVRATCPSAWPLFFGPWRTDTLTPYDVMAPSVCDAPAARLANADLVRRVISRGLGDWAWREGLHGVTAPTLVIEGSGEKRVEVASTRWAQHLPDARILMLRPPFLFPWVGEPSRFYSAVAAFLQGDWPVDAIKPPAWQP